MRWFRNAPTASGSEKGTVVAVPRKVTQLAGTKLRIRCGKVAARVVRGFARAYRTLA
jgi:hypothetical protein